MFEIDGFNAGLIAHNVVDGGISDQVGEGECFGVLGTAEDTRLQGNTVVGVDSGFAVFGSLLMIGNTAAHNEWDGIVSGAGVTLARNTARHNGNLGINGEPGTIDGGGNRASGNGNPAQCVGVVCK
jgi:hypothetical protein